MLVSAKEMLDKAKAGHYAVGQFNINNLEWTKSVLLTAEELRSPVILGVSEGAGKYMTGFGTVAAMVKAMHDELGITVPVALHLDHGTYEGCYKCIKAGFTSIMFDGSHYPIDENVEKTKELVSVAHAMGMSIEAEVGSIGGEEDGVVGMGECADPEECKRVADLGIKATVDEVCEAADEGYVVTVTDKEGYGGDIQITVGVTKDGTVSGVSILSISETAGLGMRATEAKFQEQYVGKTTDKFYVSKDGGEGEPIDAISGATITSRAFTGAVNTAIGYCKNAF